MIVIFHFAPPHPLILEKSCTVLRNLDHSDYVWFGRRSPGDHRFSRTAIVRARDQRPVEIRRRVHHVRL